METLAQLKTQVEKTETFYINGWQQSVTKKFINNLLDLVGSASAPPAIRDIAAATIITSADETLNVTAGTFSQALPVPSMATKGKIYYVKNSGNGVVTVTSASLIDGAASRVVNYPESIPFQDTGTTYIIK